MPTCATAIWASVIRMPPPCVGCLTCRECRSSQSASARSRQTEVAFYEGHRDRITIHWAKDQASWEIDAIVAPLKGRPVYVTFDIDALDVR